MDANIECICVFCKNDATQEDLLCNFCREVCGWTEDDLDAS